jgi:hypothetical protein
MNIEDLGCAGIVPAFVVAWMERSVIQGAGARRRKGSPDSAGASSRLPSSHLSAFSFQLWVAGFLPAFNVIPILSLFSGSVSPDDWFSTAMKYCQDNNAICIHAKINAVWKTIGDDTPDVLINNRKLEGTLSCQGNATVNFSQKLNCNAGPLAFIPCACVNEFCAGGTMKSD